MLPSRVHSKSQFVIPAIFGIALAGIICILSSLSVAQTAGKSHEPSSPRTEITGVYFDVSQLHHDAASYGDTWDFAWADDDSLYSFTNGSSQSASGHHAA